MARYTRVEKFKQRRDALDLFLAGKTDQEIADDLQLSKATAYRRRTDALAEQQPHEDVNRYRTRQIAENEVRRRRLMRGIIVAASDQDWTGLASLNRALTHLHEREARMLNLDKAPTPLEELRNMTDAQLDALLDDAEEENPDAVEVVANA